LKEDQIFWTTNNQYTGHWQLKWYMTCLMCWPNAQLFSWKLTLNPCKSPRNNLFI